MINVTNISRESFRMLKRFEVENFKGFKDKIVFDLTAREYNFNSNIIRNGIVNKALIYGKNGTGKSCLGIALFDVVIHLTDKEKFQPRYLVNYRNYDSSNPYATFSYCFQFDEDEIVYEYAKTDPYGLVYEKLFVNGKQILNFHFFERENNFIDKEILGSLNIELIDNRLSIVKYIYRNLPTNTIPLITKMMKFCDNMLWYRSLSEGNTYSGFTNGGYLLTEKLYESGKVHEFEEFLRGVGLDYKLEFESNNGVHELYAIFKHGRALFNTIASTGTSALFLFYIWSITAFENISLLFIDEFDAFFHFEAAESIILQLNKSAKFQTILTTHNTYLMQNKLTRPDCCYLITGGKITSLYNSTDKELREGHNLEKMYINGVFTE